MLVGKTKSDIDKLWNAFWTGGITNPVTVIEQINYLLFCRRLDDMESRNERIAERTKGSMERRIFSSKQQELRWSKFKHLNADAMYEVVQQQVFPFMKGLGANSEGVSTFAKTMSDAVFQIPKASLLSSAVELVSALDLDNSDTAGDLYEYLLSKLSTSGINGQFRTPRHIIKMMVQLIQPTVDERICDPACGTAGFLFSALQYILEQNTSEKLVQTDEHGHRHGFVGDKLSKAQRKKFETNTFFGFDFDPTMLRVAAMNLWLHGIEQPNISYSDTLSKHFTEEGLYDVILANPPFKGQLDYADCSPSLLNEVKTKKTELLFLALTLRLLDLGGRAAIIVPDGVLFGNTGAHQSIRKALVEEHQLEAVISMPGGVFRPYAGVSTGILIFSKGGKTDRVWFYDMEHDGFSLDDKRVEVEENDIPDILTCWKNRSETAFESARTKRLKELQKSLSPLKEQLLDLEKSMHVLRFEAAMAANNDFSASQKLDKTIDRVDSLIQEMKPWQQEINQINRQFWVSKKDLRESKYNLSANAYRTYESTGVYYEPHETTLKRLLELEKRISQELLEVGALLK